MVATAVRLADSEELSAPSDVFQQLTESLEPLSRPAFGKMCRRLRRERQTHLANVRSLRAHAENYASGQRSWQGFPYVVDAGKSFEEQINREQNFAEACQHSLDEAYRQYAHARGLMFRNASQFQLIPFLDWDHLLEIRPEFAAASIREALRRVSQPGASQGNFRRNANSSPDGSGSDHVPAPMIQLKGVAQKPVVMGREVDAISAPKYQVIEALLASGPDGMTKSELEDIKGGCHSVPASASKHANLAWTPFEWPAKQGVAMPSCGGRFFRQPYSFPTLTTLISSRS